MLPIETGTVLIVDPADLMRDNPAARIVNQESYSQIGSRFDPRRFDLPQATRVRVFTASREEAIRLYLIDGNTRTKYVNDNKAEIAKAHPDFEFRVRDVTGSLLDNPKIVPPQKKTEGRDYLEVDEWLRAVVPPTVEHSRIAPDRIAAHLINGWGNMVGPEVANKFSALAAISLLDSPNVPIATDNMLDRFLRSQTQLIPEENDEERRIAQKGLMEMASIIRQTKLLRRRIAESAFVLVSAGSEVIGGESQSLRQVYGLLNTVEANGKFQKAFPQATEREIHKTELGNKIMASLAQLPQDTNRSQALSLLSQSLRDPSFSIANIIDIFSSNSPKEKYDEVKLQINRGKLTQRYLADYKPDQLTPVEEQLINNLGGVAYLRDTDLRRLAGVVKNAHDAVSTVSSYASILLNQRDEMEATGVNPRIINETLVVLESLQADLLSATSMATVTNKIQALKNELTERQRRISYQQDINKIKEFADEIYGEELQSGQGQLVRGSIAACILREVGDSDEVRVKKALETLRSLSPNLQTLVIRGEMRLSVADQRSRIGVSTQTTDVPPGPHIANSTEISLIDIDETVDNQSIDARRNEINNEKLSLGVTNFNEVLDSLDLDPENLSVENKTAVYNLVRRLGQYLFNHPDIVRLAQEYPQTLAEIAQLRATRLHQDRSSISVDTQTRI